VGKAITQINIRTMWFQHYLPGSIKEVKDMKGAGVPIAAPLFRFNPVKRAKPVYHV
jgi:hypothetical protein